MALDVGVVLRHGDEGQVRGAVRKMFEYFAEEVRAQTSIRDYLEGEKAVQTLHLVYMKNTHRLASMSLMQNTPICWVRGI